MSAAVLIQAPPGFSKSTLIRALTGIWNLASGAARYDLGRTLTLAQKPYLPFGTLLDMLCYPSASHAEESPQLLAAMHQCGIGHLSDVGVALSAEGKPLGLHLPHDGSSLPPCSPFERFSSLIQGHLEPAIEVMARVSKASPRVFWSNAGNLFEFATTQTERHPLATADCSAPARAILESRLRPDGRRNPLFAPVYYKDVGASEPQRLRRICCIRYRLPGVDYCGSCPLDRAKTPE